MWLKILLTKKCSHKNNNKRFIKKRQSINQSFSFSKTILLTRILNHKTLKILLKKRKGVKPNTFEF